MEKESEMNYGKIRSICYSIPFTYFNSDPAAHRILHL